MNPSNQPEDPGSAPRSLSRAENTEQVYSDSYGNSEKRNTPVKESVSPSIDCTSNKANDSSIPEPYSTSVDNGVPDAQAELLAFVTDPKTIAKAVEGSMDKRLAVKAEVGLREKVSEILVKWGMPTRQAAINEIMAAQAERDAAVREAAEWLLEQPSNVDGYTRNSNIRALIPTNWDMGGTPIKEKE